MSNPSPTKRPREDKEANQPPTFLGYSAERYFNKMMATGELIAERDALKAKLAAAEATIAQQAAMIAEIAQASNEQSQGIAQINNAVSHMDKVTQGNASLAEETASSSEELRIQAEQVKQAVAELMRMVRGDSAEPAAEDQPLSEPEPEQAVQSLGREG